MSLVCAAPSVHTHPSKTNKHGMESHNYLLNSAWCPDLTLCVLWTVLFLRNYCCTRNTARYSDTQSIFAAPPHCCHPFCSSLSSWDTDSSGQQEPASLRCITSRSTRAVAHLLPRLRRNFSMCRSENSHVLVQMGGETAPLGPSITSTWTWGGYLISKDRRSHRLVS